MSSDSGLVIVFVFFLYSIRVFFGLRSGFLYFLPPKSFVDDSFGFRRIWILSLVRGTLFHPGGGGRKGVAWIVLFLLEKDAGCCFFLCSLCLRNCLTSSDYHPFISATIARELKFSITEMYI